MTSPVISVWAPEGVGEVSEGDDLADLLLGVAELADGDVVCVTSKVVSKAEGRVRRGDRAALLAEETRRVVARRGPLSIVVNRLGLVMAAAGIDASNVSPGLVVLLPVDPDASASRLRAALLARAGVNVAVVVTDTAGRAWREGQTDLAVGVAGMLPLDDHAGRVDPYGNPLSVTAPAVADEVASAAELVAGKLTGRPFAVLRGLSVVLPPGVDGPGAVSLVRPSSSDLFGLGSRDAVLAALGLDPAQAAGFGEPAPPADLAEVLTSLLGTAPSPSSGGSLVLTGLSTVAARVAEVAAYAHGWVAHSSDGGLSLHPRA